MWLHVHHYRPQSLPWQRFLLLLIFEATVRLLPGRMKSCLDRQQRQDRPWKVSPGLPALSLVILVNERLWIAYVSVYLLIRRNRGAHILSGASTVHLLLLLSVSSSERVYMPVVVSCEITLARIHSGEAGSTWTAAKSLGFPPSASWNSPVLCETVKRGCSKIRIEKMMNQSNKRPANLPLTCYRAKQQCTRLVRNTETIRWHTSLE